MNPIPMSLRNRMDSDPDMHECVYQNADCADQFGKSVTKPEWEHAFIYAGRQVNEWWAIIPLCWFHHQGPGLNKDFNRRAAVSRMGEDDIAEAKRKYPLLNLDFYLKQRPQSFDNDEAVRHSPNERCKISMPMPQAKPKKSKFKKCPKCKRMTLFAICEHCNAYVGMSAGAVKSEN